MNLQHEINRTENIAENRRLWLDGRVWWVNCVAVEAGWSTDISRRYLFEARRNRDAMLSALIETW